MSASTLIERLHGVRNTGPGRWLARCPTHADRSPSLSVRELDDGRVLLHDFGGCDVESILRALGLQFADLFPLRASAMRFARPTSSRIPTTDALQAIDHEAHVVAVIGADMLETREMDDPTWERLAQAVRRIGDARAAVVPLRIKP